MRKKRCSSKNLKIAREILRNFETRKKTYQDIGIRCLCPAVQSILKLALSVGLIPEKAFSIEPLCHFGQMPTNKFNQRPLRLQCNCSVWTAWIKSSHSAPICLPRLTFASVCLKTTPMLVATSNNTILIKYQFSKSKQLNKLNYLNICFDELPKFEIFTIKSIRIRSYLYN